MGWPRKRSPSRRNFSTESVAKNLRRGSGPPFLAESRCGRQERLQVRRDGAGGGFGGVDNAHVRRRHAMQQRLEQRIVGAAEDQNVRVVEAIGEGLTQINPSDLLGDGMLHPSFFDQRNQQRTSFLPRVEAAGLESFPVGVAADGSLGPDDHDFFVLADGSGGLGAGLYHAYDRHMRRGRDAVQGERRCSVAGDDQQLGSVGLEVVGSLDGITRDGFNRLRAVGEPGGIAKVEVIGVGDEFK